MYKENSMAKFDSQVRLGKLLLAFASTVILGSGTSKDF
jgi:hypothetical protein